MILIIILQVRRHSVLMHKGIDVLPREVHMPGNRNVLAEDHNYVITVSGKSVHCCE